MSAIARIEQFRSSTTAAFIVVFVAFLVDAVVYGVVIPILPKFVTQKMGIEEKYVGLLFACYSAGLLATTPVVGVLSDRYRNRQIPMLVGLLALLLTTLAFGYGETFGVLVAARIGQGIAGGISWTRLDVAIVHIPRQLCMFADIYPPSKLGIAMSNLLAANTIGVTVGPPIGGILYDNLGQHAPFIFCAGLAGIDFLGRLMLKTKVADAATDSSTGDETSRDAEATAPKRKVSMISLLKNPQVLCTCGSVLFGTIAFTGIEPTVPIYAAQQFGFNPTNIGLLFLAIVLPNIVASYFAGWISDRYGRKNVQAAGMLVVSLSCVFVGLAPTLSLFIVAFALMGIGVGFNVSPTLPEMAEFVEESGGGAYAQSYALFNMSYASGMLFGPIIGSALVDRWGFAAQMYFLAIALFLYTPILVYFHLKRVKAGHPTSAAAPVQEEPVDHSVPKAKQDILF
ncbi:major facilitator superfamily domain-containing protein [Polychytrium aggregatum]|uniref:major facilitator superfamily domain-containing protein n=1 Tax=Polychytrium aggregatum TaxID=110093 RepID=UPI0022FF2D83|nr:major facilitator superfamily domain-containing protein [Polychytrium aggregatum]KAI9207881.1 major facilitator superfamily domain-containing protein [Polychytrium aggregatum]